MVKFSLLQCFIIACLTSPLVVASYEYGLLVTSDNGSEESFCAAYVPSDLELQSSDDISLFLPLLDLTPWNACRKPKEVLSIKLDELQGRTIAVKGQSCTLLQKHSVLYSLGAVGIVVVSHGLSEESPMGNDTDAFDIKIPLSIISSSVFKNVQAMSSDVRVQFFAPKMLRYINFSLVLIGAMATCCIIIGAIYTVNKRDQIYKLAHGTTYPDCDEKKTQFECLVQCSSSAKCVGSIFILVIYVVAFFGTILSLYYFFDSMVYVFIVFFCVASAVSVYWILLPIIHFIPCGSCRIPIQIPKLYKFSIEFREIMLILCCFAVTITWGVFRHKEGMWILQDILGMSLCITCISKKRVSNLKICTIILIVFLIYDVFSVYITPLFTQDGKSVMERIVIGEAQEQDNPVEQLPTLLQVPYYSNNPLRICLKGASFILGFGDIIVPGILVSFCYDFGMQGESKMYFLVVVVGYMVGLAVTDVVLTVMKTGQPALFFLVPCTLLPVLVLGCIFKDIGKLWNFQPNGLKYFKLTQIEDIQEKTEESESKV